jgi:hypothetical protein
MCSTGCRTKDHPNFGACIRAKGLLVSGADAHAYNQNMVNDITRYREARAGGLQPKSIFGKDVDFANRMTDKLGVPYRADD